MIIPAHVLFPSGHILPLRWLRLPLLISTFALSCVCIAVGAQALVRSSQLEIALNSEAQSTGAMIIFDMNDIKNTTIVLTIVASSLALTSLIFSLSLSYDWIRHLLRSKPTRSQEKMDPSRQSGTTQHVPFSTNTLGLQASLLSFLSVWMFAVLIPSTILSRTGSAHLKVTGFNGPNLSLDIVTRYWDYGFLRCLAAAPWFSLIFSLCQHRDMGRMEIWCTEP